MAEDRRARRDRERRLHYARHRARVYNALVDATLRAEGTVDAVGCANRKLETLGLPDLALDEREVMQDVVLVLRAEVAGILLRSGFLPRSAQLALMDRVVSRLVPRRDNQPVAPSKSPPIDLARRAELGSALRREAERLARRKKP